MGFVMSICHMLKVIDHGIPIAWGTPEEIRRNEKVIAAYLGQG
jgi:ABC-type branched-subunit amino acid transport system ATPase component